MIMANQSNQHLLVVGDFSWKIGKFVVFFNDEKGCKMLLCVIK